MIGFAATPVLASVAVAALLLALVVMVWRRWAGWLYDESATANTIKRRITLLARLQLACETRITQRTGRIAAALAALEAKRVILQRHRAAIRQLKQSRQVPVRRIILPCPTAASPPGLPQRSWFEAFVVNPGAGAAPGRPNARPDVIDDFLVPTPVEILAQSLEEARAALLVRYPRAAGFNVVSLAPAAAAPFAWLAIANRRGSAIDFADARETLGPVAAVPVTVVPDGAAMPAVEAPVPASEPSVHGPDAAA